MKTIAYLRVSTAQQDAGSQRLAIDHIAHTPDLLPIGDIGIWPGRSAHDRYLSDHFGVWCDFDDVH